MKTGWDYEVFWTWVTPKTEKEEDEEEEEICDFCESTPCCCGK